MFPTGTEAYLHNDNEKIAVSFYDDNNGGYTAYSSRCILRADDVVELFTKLLATWAVQIQVPIRSYSVSGKTTDVVSLRIDLCRLSTTGTTRVSLYESDTMIAVASSTFERSDSALLSLEKALNGLHQSDAGVRPATCLFCRHGRFEPLGGGIGERSLLCWLANAKDVDSMIQNIVAKSEPGKVLGSKALQRLVGKETQQVNEFETCSYFLPQPKDILLGCFLAYTEK